MSYNDSAVRDNFANDYEIKDEEKESNISIIQKCIRNQSRFQNSFQQYNDSMIESKKIYIICTVNVLDIFRLFC